MPKSPAPSARMTAFSGNVNLEQVSQLAFAHDSFVNFLNISLGKL